MAQGNTAMWTVARDAAWVNEHENLGIGGGGSLNGHSWAQDISEKILLAYSYDHDM